LSITTLTLPREHTGYMCITSDLFLSLMTIPTHETINSNKLKLTRSSWSTRNNSRFLLSYLNGNILCFLAFSFSTIFNQQMRNCMPRKITLVSLSAKKLYLTSNQLILCYISYIKIHYILCAMFDML